MESRPGKRRKGGDKKSQAEERQPLALQGNSRPIGRVVHNPRNHSENYSQGVGGKGKNNGATGSRKSMFTRKEKKGQA